MILSGKEIKKKCMAKDSNIVIKPFNDNQLNPNSYNLRLHNELLIYNKEVLDMKKEITTKKIIIPERGYVLEPGTLYLGRTVEYTETHKYVPMLEGRSSIGRLGLNIHVTAGFGDVGFKGFWTLELTCVQPIRIYPNVEVCQIYYHEISSDHEEYSNGKYQNNKEIQVSMLYKDFIK